MNDSATIVLAVHCITHYYGFDGSRVQTIKNKRSKYNCVYLYQSLSSKTKFYYYTNVQ